MLDINYEYILTIIALLGIFLERFFLNLYLLFIISTYKDTFTVKSNILNKILFFLQIYNKSPKPQSKTVKITYCSHILGD
jgi:hypothetical protein